ncbi:MAG: serine/threonine protein kinase, partial [Chloroflexia bacterium]|nr:serine/threonine protein kinase [Chloroflexia bacterium]
MTTVTGSSLMEFLGEIQDRKQFQQLNWRGSFGEYLDLVAQEPRVTRNAFQRIYDMIMSYGTEDFIDAKKRLIRYRFFSDATFDGDDSIYGLEIPLMRLVNFFKGAAKGYGTEKRVLLLHGPVGSSKSTIVRRIKKGLEHYSKTDDGALFTYDWYLGTIEDHASFDFRQVPEAEWEKCPMHEEPLHLIPLDHREAFLARMNEGRPSEDHVRISGDLCPVCRFHFRELMRRYDGDWVKVVR